MKNKFMTNKEYEKSFTSFWNIRKKIAKTLLPYGLQSASKVLDVAAGHGFFTFEIAKLVQQGKICAIGLQNDFESYQRFANSLTNDILVANKALAAYLENSADSMLIFSMGGILSSK